MKLILHLIETGGPGGAEQMLLRLISAYARRGVEQCVVLRKDGWLADEVRSSGIDLTIVPQGKTPDLNWLSKMFRLAKKANVSAIHSHEFAMNVHSAVLARLLRVPCVMTVHGKGYYCETVARRWAYRFASRLGQLVTVSVSRNNLET